MTTETFYLAEHAVSAEFRAALADFYPALQDNTAFWRMLGLLMFRPTREDRQIVLPYRLIAKIEGVKADTNFRAYKFLEAFQKAIDVKMHISGYTLGQCRTISNVRFPKPVEALLAKERRVVNGDRVLLSTGVKWNRIHSAKQRQEQQAEALEKIAANSNPEDHPAIDLLNLLNFEQPNRFTAIKKHLPEAGELLLTLPLSKDEIKRQQNILRAISEQPQPFYSPASRSVRIFGMNGCITSLQRDVRKVVTQDWISLDLRSAQLAIVSKVWGGIPFVEGFLRSGASVWKALSEWLGIDHNEQNKAILKDFLYALIFGAGINKMRELSDGNLGKGTYKRLRSHPMIYELLAARTKQLKMIRNAKMGVDAFGTEIPLEYIAIPDKKYSYDSSRKILALIAQSYELLLLTPVIQMAIDEQDSPRGFSLCLWLHDGFCFKPHDVNDRTAWTKKMKTAVRTQAESLGIETWLEES